MKLPRLLGRVVAVIACVPLCAVAILIVLPHSNPLNSDSEIFIASSASVAEVAGASALPDHYALLTRDMYIVRDGATIVLSEPSIAGFWGTYCKVTVDSCGRELPCVDEQAVESYFSSVLMPLLQKKETVGVAESKFGSFTYRQSDFGIDAKRSAGLIVDALQGRISEVSEYGCDYDFSRGSSVVEDPIVAVGVVSAGTDGAYAPKYIEVDQSQQHLYAWEEGRIVLDFPVSGFFDRYAFFGVYKIYNKSPNAWSPIAKKWMPFWMAYYYDPIQDAWMGIHEIVYWYDENGVYQQESSDSIGQQKSAGCIRLDRGKTEILYNWVEVDIPVLIHP